MIDFLPIGVCVHRREDSNFETVNESLQLQVGEDKKTILEEGQSLIRNISDHSLYDLAAQKVKAFNRKEDENAICSYWQNLRLYDKMSYLYSHKIALNDQLTLTLGFDMSYFGKAGDFVADVLADIPHGQKGYQYFQTLTKREKEILNNASYCG